MIKAKNQATVGVAPSFKFLHWRLYLLNTHCSLSKSNVCTSTPYSSNLLFHATTNETFEFRTCWSCRNRTVVFFCLLMVPSRLLSKRKTLLLPQIIYLIRFDRCARFQGALHIVGFLSPPTWRPSWPSASTKSSFETTEVGAVHLFLLFLLCVFFCRKILSPFHLRCVYLCTTCLFFRSFVTFFVFWQFLCALRFLLPLLIFYLCLCLHLLIVYLDTPIGSPLSRLFFSRLLFDRTPKNSFNQQWATSTFSTYSLPCLHVFPTESLQACLLYISHHTNAASCKLPFSTSLFFIGWNVFLLARLCVLRFAFY